MGDLTDLSRILLLAVAFLSHPENEKPGLAMFVVGSRLKFCAFVLEWLDKPRVDAV